jgi:hypothetical protein
MIVMVCVGSIGKSIEDIEVVINMIGGLGISDAENCGSS